MPTIYLKRQRKAFQISPQLINHTVLFWKDCLVTSLIPQHTPSHQARMLRSTISKLTTRPSMNGIFAVNKRSGVSSSSVVLQLQSIFDTADAFAADLAQAKQKVHDDLTQGTRWLASKIANRVKRTKIKMGHGGTLDPLASGVLIIGVGLGTKQLAYYLGECTKTYESRAVLGQSTTTGDSEGEVISQTKSENIGLDELRKSAAKFVGTLNQTPPVFSALKVNGMPLYEYARKSIPVPQTIKPRLVRVELFVVHDFGPDPRFRPLPLKKEDSLAETLFNNPTLNDHAVAFSNEFLADEANPEAEKTAPVPELIDPASPPAESLPVFHSTATVGSGTYIRSLLSDLGRAVGLSAFMVELIRTKQANWELGKNVFEVSDFSRDSKVWGPVLKKVLDVGDSVVLAEEFAKAEEALQALEQTVEALEQKTVEAEDGSAVEEPAEKKQKISNTDQ